MRQGYAPEAQDIQAQQGVSSGEGKPVTGAAKEVAQSTKEHAREVGGEVMEQGRNLASQMRERLSSEARSQNDRLASGLRQLSDDLGRMGDGTGSVASSVVRQIGSSSRQAATYLEQHGPEGFLRDVQDFARRRPGTFLVGAAVAGFLAGRLGKGLMGSSSPSPDSATGTSRMTGMAATPTGAAVPAATGTAPAPIVAAPESPAAPTTSPVSPTTSRTGVRP